jgi:hypothetical protein
MMVECLAATRASTGEMTVAKMAGMMECL